MASGIWPAVSGATARQHTVDTVANNLANADTLGFKKDVPTFKEYLSVLEREKLAADIPRGPITNRDLYPLDGRDQSFVVVDGTYTDFKQGHLKVTQGPLDLALEGPGFFEVSTPQGVRYTRQGSFKLSMDGRLVTSEGHPVLSSNPGGLAAALPATTAVQPGQGGQTTQGGVAAEPPPEVVSRYINLRDAGGAVSVAPNGEVYAGGRRIASISLVEFTDRNALRKQGDGLFISGETASVVTDPPRTMVRQGMLETSNVNMVKEMTDLIRAHRMFQHDMKAIRTYGDMMEKEANEIGKM